MKFTFAILALVGAAQARWCCCQNPFPFCDAAGFSQQSCSSAGLAWQSTYFSSGCDVGNTDTRAGQINEQNFRNGCARNGLHSKCY
ncbi:hypothetical protein NQZ79_g6263 [Umbelopsis isabellina]|nr:hypothetical protein NQZ79_g6263 [Umbelopsis isabellina]